MAVAQTGSVPEEARWKAILQFLNETNLALPPTAIFVNLNRENRIQFGERTLKKHLKKMREAGLVEYYDEKRGYYQITEAGRVYLSGDSQ